MLKSQIHRLEEEREFEQFKLKEITEENAQLIVDKENRWRQSCHTKEIGTL